MSRAGRERRAWRLLLQIREIGGLLGDDPIAATRHDLQWLARRGYIRRIADGWELTFRSEAA